MTQAAPATNRAMFCDLDETLYPGQAMQDIGRALIRDGYISRVHVLKLAWWLVLYTAGLLNHDAAFGSGLRLVAGWPVDKLEAIVRTVVKEEMVPRIPPDMYALVADWQKTHRVVLVTETLSLVATPLANSLGITDVLGTEIEIIDGRITGRLSGTALYNERKHTRVQAWAKSRNVDIENSLAVGGRRADIPLLRFIGHGIALNPDRALEKAATQAGWQIIQTS